MDARLVVVVVVVVFVCSSSSAAVVRSFVFFSLAYTKFAKNGE